MAGRNEAQLRDSIIQLAKIGKGMPSVNVVAKTLRIDENLCLIICRKLEQESYLKLTTKKSTQPTFDLIGVTPEGKSLAANHFTEKHNREVGEKNRKEELEHLQLTDIKKRLESYDKQAKFHETSIQRNEEHIKFLKNRTWTIWFALLLSVIAILVSIFYR